MEKLEKDEGERVVQEKLRSKWSFRDIHTVHFSKHGNFDTV